MLPRPWQQEHIRPRLVGALGWGLLSALLGVLAIEIDAVSDLDEDLGLHWLFNLRGPVRAPDEVIVVALDEQSKPDPSRPRSWPRNRHADVVRYLSKAGARLISFDMTFEAPSVNPTDDEDFASATSEAGNVLLTELIRRGPDGDSDIPPIPILAQAALGYAPFLLPKDSRVNKYWTVFELNAKSTPTLPVLAFHAFRMDAGNSVDKRHSIHAWMSLHSASETKYLNYYGPPRSILTVRYDDVWERARTVDATGAEVAPSPMFRNKAVFVGFSAANQVGQNRVRDDYRTVFSQPDGFDISGVEIAATAFANLVEDRPLRPLSKPWQRVIVFAWGLVMGIACRLLRPIHASVVVAVMVAIYLLVIYHRFVEAAWWLPSIIPIGIQAPVALFAGVWLSYRDSTREREIIKRAFGYFLPSAIVDQLARNVGPVTRGNSVVFGACLATDVEKYTTLAERMDPGRLGELMNEYYAELFVPVERSQGVVVDVVGDAMVAVWAKASSGSELRSNACQAALDIVARLDRFNMAPVRRPAVVTRLGLHSGDMLVGSIGASGHYEHRAVGDIVNTASRIQGLNKVLGTRLLASEATVAGLQGFATRPLGSFLMAGKSNVVAVVELLGRSQDMDSDASALCAMFTDALDSYRAGRFREASERFSKILDSAPDDGPSRFYLERCEQLMSNPPGDDWTSSIRIDTK